MSTPALRLRNLDKLYRSRGKPDVHAVKNMSLEIGAGEIVALLGASGCGKTSTLRMIAGFEEVSGGAIELGGRPVHTLHPARRGVAMAFEGYSLYPPLTVRDNIGFALKSARLPRAESDSRILEMARLLEIEDILDRYPSSISGGQQQRASLGRALVRSADLYLLDEPMGQLEPQLRAVLRGRLKHFLRERRMTAVLVTHDQTEANALADRIAIMDDGVLQQYATPAELKARPANLYVGTFIGEPPMNVFMAAPGVSPDGVRFILEGGDGLALSYPSADLPAPIRELLARRDRVALGIRPHALRLAEHGLPARILSNQWLGDQAHVAAELAGITAVAVAHHRVPAATGEAIALAVAAADLHLFDPATGAALAHGGALA